MDALGQSNAVAAYNFSSELKPFADTLSRSNPDRVGTPVCSQTIIGPEASGNKRNSNIPIWNPPESDQNPSAKASFSIEFDQSFPR